LLTATSAFGLGRRWVLPRPSLCTIRKRH